jgi:hypothetical protein
LLSVALLHCSSFRSCCCSALLLLSVALLLHSCSHSCCCSALLLLSLALLVLLHDLRQLQELLLWHSLTVLLHELLSASAFPARAAADLDHCFSATSARAA